MGREGGGDLGTFAVAHGVNVFDAATAFGLAALAVEHVARPVSAAATGLDAGLYVPVGDHIARAKDHGAFFADIAPALKARSRPQRKHFSGPSEQFIPNVSDLALFKIHRPPERHDRANRRQRDRP